MIPQSVETTDLVCIQHDRYWPCHNLGSDGPEHVWAFYTVMSVYMERGVDTEHVDTLDLDQSNE